MEKADWNKIIQKILEFINKNIKEQLEEIEKSTKNKKPLEIIGIFSSVLVAPIALFVALIPILGIVLSLIVGLLIGYGVLKLAYHYLKITSNDSEDAKKHIPNDLGKNVPITKTRRFSKGKVIKIFIILLVVYLLYANFHTYFVDPKITITSPRSGDVVKIDKDNTFHKISGTSKGLANSQFFHLFILYRRVDSNQEPSGWHCDCVLLRDHCTVYNDGSWECRIQLNELYEERIYEGIEEWTLFVNPPTNSSNNISTKFEEWTLFVKSPTNSSNNISTNVDIVAIITKQPIMHSVFTKLKSRRLQVLNEVDGPDWYKLIISLLPTGGMGTFYDQSYDLSPDWRYDLYYHLPKHLADDHVTITPLIVDYPTGTCWSLIGGLTIAMNGTVEVSIEEDGSSHNVR